MVPEAETGKPPWYLESELMDGLTHVGRCPLPPANTEKKTRRRDERSHLEDPR